MQNNLKSAFGDGAVNVSVQPDSDSLLFDEIADSIEVGIAVFDENYKIIQTNDHYHTLCSYSAEQVKPGNSLEDLIKFSLKGSELSEEEINSTVQNTFRKLRTFERYQFGFQTVDNRKISVTRRKGPNGRLIETVQELKENVDVYENSSQLESLADLARTRLSYALESMPDGFALYDSNDRIVSYNQQYVDLNPHIADLIVPGARFETMLRQGVERGGFELDGMEHEEFVQWRMQQHLNPGEPYIVKMSDGKWIRLNDRTTPDGGIISLRSDISDLKEQEFENERISDHLNIASNHLDEALNNMVQGLCMFDADRRLILCNDQYLKMYGFSDEVVKPGILMADIMRYSISLGNYRKEDAEKALANRNDKRNLSERTVIKQYLKDGRVIAVLNEPMGNGGTIATYEDITKLETNESQLIAYNKKLEDSNRELQDFAYVASHDLQEPLRKIEAFGDRLAKKYQDLLPEDGQMYLERMQNSSGRMRQLINDLLSYSRVTTNAKPFQKVDLNKVLSDVVSDIQMRIEESGGRVEYSDLPTLDSDATQMRQLFQNLTSNALKFARPNVDPVVKITAELVVVATGNGIPVDTWRIKLSDNGIGFENKFKEQIFAIFQRLHGRQEYEGTGIGLATCRKIVERHRGTIDANGVPDEGATFIIELPAIQINDQENVA